ncbi:MAG: hypothetical protein KDA84_19205 [Planctomycetaceae bacterium]|nr:hypothetical protein [Planctomycetaceae bacterium]
MTTETGALAALFISPDLLFAGKIQAAAGPLGMRVFQETSLPAIERTLAEQPVVAVLLDLNITTPTLAEVMGSLPVASRPLTVAFGPHVNTQRLEEARTAGFDHVLPRSRFVNELPELLKTACNRGAV